MDRHMYQKLLKIAGSKTMSSGAQLYGDRTCLRRFGSKCVWSDHELNRYHVNKRQSSLLHAPNGCFETALQYVNLSIIMEVIQLLDPCYFMNY